MMGLGWPEVAAIIGSVASTGLVVYKIYTFKATKPNAMPDDCKTQLQKLQTEQAVQEGQMSHLKEEMSRLSKGFEKLNDLLLRLLSDK